MMDSIVGPAIRLSDRAIFCACLLLSFSGLAQTNSAAESHRYFLDCSSTESGEGTLAHPWNTLAKTAAHLLLPGDSLALKRGTVCHGAFAPQGSGAKGEPIRLTAYGEGPRPRIIASSTDRQVLFLSNQEYWQVDSLDLSGANTFGIYVTGDKGTLHHIYLKNLYVHDVYSDAAMKNKDNGLVVVGPGKLGAAFDDVLVDGVDAEHTNKWAGILVGGGPFYIPPEAFINNHVIIRNSTVHDVYGDGIVLFRDSNSSIETSAAWQTGMQPTETTGTPNAIWTWTCTDCTVQDNEAFLTDSPGVDGGAYDIDWSNTGNVVQRNYAHDTQGYCFAVFAAGYVTADSIVRDNLCIDNGLSPRLAAMQGAAYLSTWNGGVIRNLRIDNNTFVWNPPVASAAAIVDVASVGGAPIQFSRNRVESAAPLIYRSNASFAPSANRYLYTGAYDARFTLGDRKEASLADLQAAGFETGSILERGSSAFPKPMSLRMDATIEFALDSDGLLAPDARRQLIVLRSLAAQYGSDLLSVNVHIGRSVSPAQRIARANALLDFDATMIHFDEESQRAGSIRLLTEDGKVLEEWHGFQNAATLGGAVRARLGAPHYARMAVRQSGVQNR